MYIRGASFNSLSFSGCLSVICGFISIADDFPMIIYSADSVKSRGKSPAPFSSFIPKRPADGPALFQT